MFNVYEMNNVYAINMKIIHVFIIKLSLFHGTFICFGETINL